MYASTPISTRLAAAALCVSALSAPAVQAFEHTRPHHPERRLLSEFRKLPAQDLKTFYLRCSDAASQGLLGSGETALCSVGYEILLQETFGGDFYKLLTWSRQQSSHADKQPLPTGD